MGSGAEGYGMLRSWIIVGVIFLCCVSSLHAEESPASVSAAENGGYIQITLVLPNSTESTVGTVSYWLLPPGSDCSTAQLLGWQTVLSTDKEATLKAAVPSEVIPGTYQIFTQYNQRDQKISACDLRPIARTNISFGSIGKEGTDMSGALSGRNASGSEPVYRIDSMTGIDTLVRISPGDTLSPVLTITNTGANDTSALPIEVHGFLGSHELIPSGATFKPLNSGESTTITPVFSIPDTITPVGYPFFVILDPRGEHGQVSKNGNLKRAIGQIGFKLEAPDIGCNCK